MVNQDEVTTPGGTQARYEWVDTPDLVRVAACGGGRIWVVEQEHYLPGRRMWQLPGGSVDPGERPAQAAARELIEEIGVRAAQWTDLGAVWPMPGLTPARVHLWLAERLEHVGACLEPSEADLTARPVSVDAAVDAVEAGQVGCAASALLIARVWHQVTTGE